MDKFKIQNSKNVKIQNRDLRTDGAARAIESLLSFGRVVTSEDESTDLNGVRSILNLLILNFEFIKNAGCVFLNGVCPILNFEFINFEFIKKT